MRDAVPAAWETAILVCAKCGKRQGGGFGPKGRTSLAKLLRTLLPKGKRRRQPFGVVEVKCLGLCPKDAVVAVDARRPGEWLLVRPGTTLGEVSARLGLGDDDSTCRLPRAGGDPLPSPSDGATVGSANGSPPARG